MSVFKYVLMGLGGLFLLVCAGVGYALIDSRTSQADNQVFLESVLNDVGGRWRAQDIDHAFAPEANRQLASLKGVRFLRQMSRLGEFKEMRDLKTLRHQVGFPANFTELTFRAFFENGYSDMTVVLQFDGKDRKILQMNAKAPVLSRAAAIKS